MRRLAFVACMAAIGIAARADVVTNTWINPSGGGWFASENVVSTNVQDEVEVVTTNVVYTNWEWCALHLDERRLFAPVEWRGCLRGEG